MREIKINDFMEIHFSTKNEDYSFSHGLGRESRKMEVVKDFDVVVQTKKGDWVSITHAIPEDFHQWCFERCELALGDVRMSPDLKNILADVFGFNLSDLNKLKIRGQG